MSASFFFATANVFYRDISHIVQILLSAWFYVSPVLYPLDPRALPRGAERFIPYLKLNPLSWFMESYHAILYYGRWPSAEYLAPMLLGSLVTLVGGYLFFAWLRPRIPEEV